MTKQPKLTDYVVIEKFKGKSCSRPDDLVAYYNPVNFLVITSSKKRALARVKSELGRVLRQPVVIPLSQYCSRK